MRDYFTKYKKLFIPLILLIVYAIFTVYTWGKWGNLIYDSFREAIIPQAMLDGHVLYSDITCIYPPFAYQLNAMIFKIFNNSLNVLYCISVLCTIAVLTIIYKIAEKKLSLMASFTLIITIMGIFIFRIIFNNSASWYFPYSYSFLYAFVSCVSAFYLYTLYKDTDNKPFLYLSTFFAGLSVSFKLDFILFSFLIIYELFKKKSLKDFAYCVLLFITPTIFSYGIWFITGGSIDGLLQYKKILIDFSKTHSLEIFNDNLLIQTFSKVAIKFLKKSVYNFILMIFTFLCLSTVLLLSIKIIKNLFLKILSSGLILLICYVYIIKEFLHAQLKILTLHYDLNVIPYIVIISALFIFIYKISEKNYTDKEKFYFLITVVSFLMSYRVLAAIFISYIGNFIMIMYWFAFLYLVFEILPEYIPLFKNDFYKKLVCITLVLYSFTYTSIYISNADKKINKISFKNSPVYVQNSLVPIKSTISYIKKHSFEKDTVLVVDEGLIINFYTKRKTDYKYYALIPHMVDAFGEEKIISDLSNNLPDYIIVLNNYYPYTGFWGKDYAQKIMKFVIQKYDLVKTYKDKNENNTLKIKIYKKKVI